MSDKRQEPRISLLVIAELDLGWQVWPCVLLNLSEGGLALLTDVGAEPEGPVQVRFRLGGADASQACIDAEIVHRDDDQPGGTSKWGLRSMPLDLGTRTRVRDLVLSSMRAA